MRDYLTDNGVPFVERNIRADATAKQELLQRSGELENAEVVRYLNRCSDLLFMLARDAEQGATVATGGHRRD